MGGDLSAGRRVPVPMRADAGGETSLTTAPGQPDDGGDARRRARKEHTARQAERARQRREDDRPRTAAANAAKARATPATKPTGQRSDGGTAVFRPPN